METSTLLDHVYATVFDHVNEIIVPKFGPIKLKHDNNIIMYRQQRNKVVDLVKVAKKNYFHQKIEHCKGKSAKLWHQIKKLSGKNVNQDFSTFIVKDGKTVSDPKSISNYLNDYFVNIASSLVVGIPDGAYNPSDLASFYQLKTTCWNKFQYSVCYS